MRVYFLSYKPAILKLNGLYVGVIDLFERHVEIDLNDSVLAEIVPGENLQGVNFFINERLLFSPPPFLDVYLMSGEALVYVRETLILPSSRINRFISPAIIGTA